ncbi:MAG TPA: holo-ACP synthase [Planctomycetota bacterium]|nr:holo-ACP synthase [Planctomycetota bacterium]
MIVGVGIDLIELERIQAVYERHRERFVSRILTASERAYVLKYADPTQRLAGRWAAKEAALKALGTGLAQGIGWRDVEILPDEHGKPLLTLHGKALERAAALGARVFHVTISHSITLAIAQVILEC